MQRTTLVSPGRGSGRGWLFGRKDVVSSASILVLVFVLTSPAMASVFKWQPSAGSADGNFNDASHWDQSGGPPNGNSDTAIIDYNNMGGHYTVTITTNADAGSLTLNSVDATLSDEGQHTIAIGGTTDLKVGIVNFGSNALWSGNGISGPITVEGPVQFNVDSGIGTIREDLTNSGTFKIAGTLYFDTLTTTTNKASFTLDAGATVNVVGSTFDENAGTLGIDSTAAFNLSSGGVFKYSGGTVSGTVSLIGANLNLSAGGPGTFIYQFTSNSLDGTIAGQSIIIQGSDSQGAASVTWKSGFTNASGFVTLTSTGASAHNSTLIAAAGNTLVNSSEIDFLPGTGGTRFIYADAISNTSSGGVNVKTSTISDHLGRVATSITNAGSVLITSAGTFNVSDFGSYTQTAGTTQVDGTLKLTPSTTTNILHLDGGNLKGTGSVIAQIAGSGTARISPGDSLGTLSVTGNVTFGGASGMIAELGSSGSPGTSDLLAITGNLSLSGSSALDLSGGAGGGFYTIVTYSGSLSGTFSSVTAGYSLDYSHTGEIRVVGVPVPGDYNGNGVVDAADYTVWRDHLGQTFQLQNEGSGQTPGAVTVEDYDFWKAHFGMTSGSASSYLYGESAVPEPATASLLMAGIGILLVGRLSVR
jgi:hypothetical protein